MNPLLLTHKADLDVIMAHYKAQVAAYPFAEFIVGGSSDTAASNWFTVATKFVASVWEVLKNAGTEAEIRAALVAACEQFYDETLMPVLSAAVGRPIIFTAIVNPAIRASIPVIVNGIVNGLFTVARGALPPSTDSNLPTDTRPQTPSGFTPY